MEKIMFSKIILYNKNLQVNSFYQQIVWKIKNVYNKQSYYKKKTLNKDFKETYDERRYGE